MRFQHDKNGIIAIYNDKKYILGYLTIGKERENFSDTELSQYAQIVLDFQCNVRALPRHIIESQNIFTNGLLENDYRPIYKYMKCCVQPVSATLPFNLENTSFGVR